MDQLKKHIIEWHITNYGTCDYLRDVPQGATIDTINGKDVIGYCEWCSRPVLENEKCSKNDDSVICSLCYF